ncbi:MAG: hypothetical protein IJY26_00255 [Clostridia bacterium]|nr:hypothetical protein [Clostridia bacterium]
MQRKKIKLAVHPLFWVFGIYFCFTNQFLVFALLTVSALEHECAHAFAAAKLGYTLNRIVLMPYGAIVKGDIGSISLKDEIFVAAAGPIVSAATALAFVAVWWLFPETYAFTDTAAYACASLAAVNLLPAMPLDGGRISFCLLAHFFGRKRAWVVCRILSFTLCGALFLGFIYTAFHTLNISLLFFALFLGVGCLQGDHYGYERMQFSLAQDLSRGLEERRVAVSHTFPLRKVIPLLRRDKYLVLDVFSSEERYLTSVRQEELCAWLEEGSLEESVGDFLKNRTKNAKMGVEKAKEV